MDALRRYATQCLSRECANAAKAGIFCLSAMSLPLYIVDAFANGPFTGNPAAVVLIEEGVAEPDATRMQAIAHEMNLSETAFVRFGEATGENRFHLRWFTPQAEVELCGHATLASAHVLYDAAKVNLHTPILFETRGGLLRAAPQPDHDAFTLDFPATPPVEEAPPIELLKFLGIDATCFAGRSRFDWFLELESPEAVRALSPDFEELATLRTRGVIVSAANGSGEVDVVSRCFYPGLGVDEDPVTGSAHCCIGPYFARTLGRSELRCDQASRRGGRIDVRVEGDRVYLTGKSVSVLRGQLLV